MEIKRKKVKDYFEGPSQKGPLILFIVGMCTIIIVIGVFLLIAALVWFLVNKFSPDLSGEAEVDAAKNYEIEKAKERAKEKLNLADEQIDNVDPVVVAGRGYQPAYVEGMVKVNQLVAFFKKLTGGSDKKKDEYEDPVYMTRIGSDGKFRSSLIRTSVFMFGETQLYIYYSEVDLRTGIVYSEGTHEYFYSDINALTFAQDKEKIYNFRTKRYEGVLFECVKIFASGCNHTATLFSDIDKSVVEKEFAGMRSLIREKKNA